MVSIDWDIWEMVSEDFSSLEVLVGKEIRNSSLGVSSGLIVGHSLSPGVGGDSVFSSSSGPVEVEAVLLETSSSVGVKDLIDNSVGLEISGVLELGGSSSPEFAKVVGNPVSFSVSGIIGVVGGGSFESSHVRIFSKGFWHSGSKVVFPLFVGVSLELSPNGFLGSGDTIGRSCWAVIDWSSSSKSFVEILVVPASLEDEDDDHDVKEGKSDEDETEHLSTSESGDETSMGGVSAGIGNSGVGVDSDSHSNVTGNDGGNGSGKVRGSSVWEVGWGSLHAHLEEINSGSENDSERA